MPDPAATQEILTMFVTNFAEAAAVGNFDGALIWAGLAQERWMAANEKAMRARAKTQGIPWPLPGHPGADDAKGWDGWYGGGYGGAIA